MTNEPTQIDLSKLPLPQLIQLNEQYKQQTEYLGSAMRQLREVRSKFAASRVTLKNVGPQLEDTTTLVPLTESLYVPGKLTSPNKVILSIGTGYFAEMDVAQAEKYLSKRINYVSKQIDKLGETHSQNLEIYRATSMIVSSKAQAATAAQK